MIRAGSLFGVDADVVDEHLLGEDGRGVGGAGPTAANGDVENDEEGVVEGPDATGGPLGLREGAVEIGIYVETDGAGFPLDGVEMKSVGEILTGGQAEGRGGVARAADGAWAME